MAVQKIEPQIGQHTVQMAVQNMGPYIGLHGANGGENLAIQIALSTAKWN